MPQYDFKRPRIFVEADLSKDAAVAASPLQMNYLLNVMRLKEDDQILAFNGRDGEWRCALRKPARKRLEFAVIERLREQTSAPDLQYLFAPLKHARLDYMVQKAVEMGAGVLQPVITQRVQANRFNAGRMRANAIEAAEQCGILTIPDCRQPIKFTAMIDGWDMSRSLIFCDEREESSSPIEMLQTIGNKPLALLIGPEGGFSDEERRTLNGYPFVTAISLGPRILRADTAAVAALAILQAAIGDW